MIQNATDLGDEVTVLINVDADKLTFSHDGKPFSLIEAYNLIMPDSGKDEDHEQGKSIIGQFGTGFISTHILSSHIRVEGIAHDDEDGTHYSFSFNLDRTHRTDKEMLIESIKSSEQDLHRGMQRMYNYGNSRAFETTFTYSLQNTYADIDGSTVVKKGIDFFSDLIPYVFCFRPQLKTVQLNDNRNGSEKWQLKKTRLNTTIPDLNLLEVIAYKNGEENLRTIVGSISNEGVTIALELERLDGDRFTIQDYPENVPKLFCAFPMIGSEGFNFPVVINSEEFVPNRERDGIELSDYDAENRACIEKAVRAYERLLQIIEEFQWTQAYYICQFKNETLPDRGTNRWLTTKIKNPLKESIYQCKMIDTYQENGRIGLVNAVIPYVDRRVKERKLVIKRIFDLAKIVIPVHLPLEEEYVHWYEAIDFDFYDEERLTLEDLINSTSSDIKSVVEFSEETQKSSEETFEWLNELISLVIDQDEYPLLSKYQILPSQTGLFRKLSELKIDDIFHKNLNDSYEEKLKDIYLELTGEDYRNDLLHHDIPMDGLISEHQNVADLKDFCLLIDKELREFTDYDQDPDFLNTLKLMFHWYSNCGLSEKQLEEFFPWFSKNKPQLYMNTQNSTQREQTFDILLSGKTEALSRLANSNLTSAQIQTIAANPSLITSFMDWLNQKVEDNPDEELGDIGEEFVLHELCKRFGETRVQRVNENENEYDFIVRNRDRSIRYYVDAKTTARGIGNSDNIPFYMRYAQWNFLPREDVQGKYIIARVFKSGEQFGVRFLNVRPELFGN